MTTTFGFLDSNIFLHFVPIDQVQWPELLGCRHVTLVVTSPVIRELNKRKDAPTSLRLRERAAAALKKLDGYSDNEGATVVRAGVDLRFRTQEPLLSFVSEALDRELSDDRLIATILEFQREGPEADIVLVTDDLGLKLKAPARGIRVFRPPENLRLPDELDASQKRIKELEETVLRLQSQVPEVTLTFRAKGDRLHFALKPEIALSPKVLGWRMRRVGNMFPRIQTPVEPSGPDLEVGAFPPAAYDAYNEQLERFFADYEKFLFRMQDYLNQKRRIIPLDIWAWNRGSCPARDLDIFLYLPDDINVLIHSNLPKRPAPPEPPTLSVARRESPAYAVNYSKLADPFGGSQSYVTVGPWLGDVGNASSSNTKLVGRDGRQVNIHIGEAKHNLMTSADTIHVQFKSHAQVRSFSLDYDIFCGNIPEKQRGQLHVIVERRA